MRHDQHQHPSKPGRDHARKEWDRSHDDEHQREGREHARLPGKTHRTQGVREREAERQIRELRERY